MSETVGSRRGELLSIKLRALVAEHLGRPVDAEAGGVANGAALVVDGHAWVLIDGDAERSLGQALAWAVRHEATSLDLIADSHTGLLARRAERFSFPITVWYPVERSLLPAVAEPLPAPPEPPVAHLEVRDVIEAAGATFTVEHGVVTGEVHGLEVCRVVESPTSGYFDEPDGGEPISSMASGAGEADAGIGDLARGDRASADRAGGDAAGGDAAGGDAADRDPAGGREAGVIVEVGVGGPDREAFRIIHGDLPTVDALTEVVATVRTHRTPGASPHPLNRLAQERLLRWRLSSDPGLIGMRRVEPADPPLPRRGLNEVVPCVASAVDPDGQSCRVVCSVGVDLDLVPFVADLQALTDDPIMIALPSRDLMPITRDLAGLLRTPISIAAVD